MNTKFKLVCAVLYTISLVLLTACGGDGGDGGTATGPVSTSAPTLSLTPQSIKTFRFTWTDVSDETEYRLLENPDGSSGYAQVATIAAGSTSHYHVTFLPRRINASYILQACNSGGCTDSAPVFVSDSLATAVGYVKASNAEAGDYFGYSIALSADGNTLAVGASGEDSIVHQTDNSAADSGAVYVYTRQNRVWVRQAYLKAHTGILDDYSGDYFGTSVALSADGSTLAVGARGDDSSATGINGFWPYSPATNSGAVYVFTRYGINWSQQAYVKASNTSARDWFGSSVALSADGNTLAVGAWGEDSAATGINGDQTVFSPVNSGAVYVFTRSGTVWSQQAYVKASNTGDNDEFGISIALSADGNTLAVGAHNESSNATGIGGDQTNDLASYSGAVYVFARSGGVWSQQAYVKASNTGGSDEFGTSVALSADGNTLAVGAKYESSNATGINGIQTDNSATSSGAVYVFTRFFASIPGVPGSIPSWNQQAYVKASNTAARDWFGSSVALSADGNTLAVGAHNESSNATGIGGIQTDNSASNSGAVYVYARSVGAWNQQAYVKASNTGTEDYFGYSVALAGDGNTLAVGAWGEDSNATDIDGIQADNSATNSGAVYLY